MSKQKRMIVLSFAIFLSLLAAAAMPLVVLAQDEVPPQPDTPVEVEDEPVVDEPVAGESVVESAPEETITEEVTIPEILEQLPEDTGLVVVDKEGETLPLVSTEAAEVLASGDPYFWDGTSYVGYTTTTCPPIVSTCNVVAANSIQAAVDAFQATATAAGNIIVEAGDYSGDVVVDGSTLGNLGNLTGIIGAGSGSTTLNGSFYITGMNAFTLSGFTVTTDTGDAIYIADNTGALQLTDLDVTSTSEEASGIRVDGQTGDVNFTGVNSTNENGIGIYINVLSGNVNLDNVAANDSIFGGASISVDSGNITVSDSEFLNNGYDGLYVSTYSGSITLNNVTATGNGDNGVYISGDSLLLKNNAVQSITSVSTGANVNVICGNYSDNDGYGLVLDAGGNTYLGGPTLTGNGLGGYNLISGTVSSGLCGQTNQNKAGNGNGELQNDLPGEPPVCNGEKKVVLGAGDGFGVFQNLCGLNFQLEEVKANVLPGVLPGGFAYIAGMDVGISNGRQVVEELPVGGKITLKFPIPAGADETSLAVLLWNDSTWVEVPGGKIIDGFYVVEVNQPGIYVLAS